MEIKRGAWSLFKEERIDDFGWGADLCKTQTALKIRILFVLGGAAIPARLLLALETND